MYTKIDFFSILLKKNENIYTIYLFDNFYESFYFYHNVAMMHFKRVYYSNGKVHYEGYSKSKKFSNQKQIDNLGIFIYNLEGHVRRYDHDGNVNQTLRLKNGVRIPLERVEQRQKSTECPGLANIGKQDTLNFNLLELTECYSGEIAQVG